ncbi:hypothetical protein Taro_013337, partial [Colocasia esculenta]|nr:hypothetical protein [Colocasia esculenta]
FKSKRIFRIPFTPPLGLLAVQQKDQPGRAQFAPRRQGRLNVVIEADLPEEGGVVNGIIHIHSQHAFVLIDTRAAYSFVSTAFAATLLVEPVPMKSKLTIASPLSSEWELKHYLPKCETIIGGHNLPANLICLDMKGCDAILGVDWLIKYKHFYAKDESTHPSMVSTHQHIFKGKMCKNVETVSTHVKSVSTRVAVDTLLEQVDTRSRFQNSQFEELGQQVDTLSEQVDTLSEQVDTGPSSQNSLLHILDSVSTLPPGQVDTLRKLFILKVDGCHVSL